MKCTLNAKYTKADHKIIAEISTRIDPQDRNELKTILKKYESLFDGNIGTRHGKHSDHKLKLDAERYNGKPFSVQHIHELTSEQELDQFEGLKVIKKVNRSQWGAPTFLIPKKVETIQAL